MSTAALFHLAWGLVLARGTGQDDVVFGTVLFGRTQGGSGAERGLGLFINTLPLRGRADGTGVEPGLRRTQSLLTPRGPPRRTPAGRLLRARHGRSAARRPGSGGKRRPGGR
ncbi:condensation domain-containing protein [Streptomyces sp. AC627_RSS907]|uniref:condensation domain-containing protein n=1 Tax=Streptomyces sp. AC627_RSS907 TaxID=2823684 RepID=UPI0027E478D7|nr:condensation domain-containing protein [Streptomyces sp. AC627_RSS907]